MYPILLNIWGPISIQSYGFMIVLGISLMLWLMLRDPRRQALISPENLVDLVAFSILAGAIGGHILHVLEESTYTWHDFFKIWEGFSILGSVIGVTIFLIIYLQHKHIPLLPILDLIATYGGLLQGFGRIGCFLAGCCYGAPTDLPWSVTYTNVDVVAPLCIALHPSQLYSAALLFGIFLLMYFVLQNIFKKPGQLTGLYLLFIGIERCATDFFRSDRTFISFNSLLSFHQLLAFGISVCGLLLFLFVSYRNRFMHANKTS